MPWPSHHHPPSPLANSRRKNKQSEKVGRNHPVLDYGAVEAATLVSKNDRLEWDSLISAQSPESRLRITQSLDVFPPTKSPPLPEPIATVNQRADSGAHFLRTRFPDVDVAGELIRDLATQDALQNKELAKFDPFEGNLLDVVVNYGEPSRQIHLAFPMGEVDAELNLSPVQVRDDGKLIIKPNTTAVRTFSTPIQQILSSPIAVGQEGVRMESLLAIRTFGATSLLKFDPVSRSIGGLVDVAHLTSNDCGEAPVIDVKISLPQAPFEVLLVNGRGGVYGCSLRNNRKTMVKLYVGPEPSPVNPFWRIALGSKLTECTILSEKAVTQLDFRTNQTVPLYAEPSKDILTSIESFAQDKLVRLCSTSQIIWLDPRFPGKPLLGYRHRRQYDRTLHTSTLFSDGSPITFLSSRRNGLLTIYNVSQQHGSLIHANDWPYSILSPSRSGLGHSGQAFLQHGTRAITIFRIDQRASVHCLELQSGAVEGTELTDSAFVEESDAVRELREKVESRTTHMERFGDQDKTNKDLFPAYDHIFRLHAGEQERAEEEQAEEIYDVIDRLPTFWQTIDAPPEHMLTSYDVVFRAHDDLDKSSRSDFVAGSLINTTRGFRALSQNKFPIDELRKGVPWHVNIADVYKKIDPDLDLDAGVEDLANSLRAFDLAKDNERPVLPVRRENIAREQLAVDLVLSRDIYSTSAFTMPREVGNDLETMTEALSLGGDAVDEPAEVEFGYLRPVAKGMRNHCDKEQDGEDGEREDGKAEERVSLPMGVRLLMRDWEVGTKVSDYVYTDPYDTTGGSAARPRVHPATMSGRTPSLSQRPPTVLPAQLVVTSGGGGAGTWSASQPLAGGMRRLPMATSSLEVLGGWGTQPGPPSSQPQGEHSQQYFMASTQVLPGPHGGRPKKAVKKRLGGF